MFIVQRPFGDSVAVVPPMANAGTAGSSDVPSGMDFSAAFTVYVDLAKGAYSGEVLFLYMQDWQTGSGGINNGVYQTTPQNVSSLRLTQIVHPTNPSGLDRYTVTVPAGQYAVLMNSPNVRDDKILRPTVYIGHTPNLTTQATWKDFVMYMDVWGTKNLKRASFPATNNTITVELNQYDTVKYNLEQLITTGTGAAAQSNITVTGPKLAGNSSATNYTWYLRDQYGANSSLVSTVNNPSAWLNNIYQSGFKPWINSAHVDMTNQDFVSTNGAGASCYTLYYYVIPTSFVSGGYTDTTTFKSNATKVIVKIKPVANAPVIANPITIVKNDYGSAAAGTTWGPQLPAGQTTYTWQNDQYLPQDGRYTIMQDIVGQIWYAWPKSNLRPPDWYVPPGGYNAPAGKFDHTSGDGTGFMYVVNSNTANGVFYKTTFNVCQGMNLQFSMWLSNLCDGTRSNNSDYSKYRIKPNIRVQIWPDSITTATPPASGTPLLDYYTGEIPMTGVWEQYFTPVFPVPASIRKVTIFYLSVPNGGDGNDFMMDDVEIQRSNGVINFKSANQVPCLTVNDTYTIKAAWDTVALKQTYPSITNFNYQWTYYPTTNLDSISTVTGSNSFVTRLSTSTNGSISSAKTDTIVVSVPGTQAGIYKLTYVGSGTGQSLTDPCAVYSYYVFSPSNPPHIQASPSGSICPGDPVKLTVDITKSNVPDKNMLLWYMDGAATKPLLNLAGDQVTGDTIIVTPFENTTYSVKISGCSNQLPTSVEVYTGPAVDLGELTNGTYTISYDARTAEIPVTLASTSTANTINYQVYQDGIAGALLLNSGTIPAVSTISISLNSIKPSVENFRNGLDSVVCAVLLKDNTNNCSAVQKFKIRFTEPIPVALLPNITVLQDSVVGGTHLIPVVDQVNSGPVGSATSPTRLDFGNKFKVEVNVLPGAYQGKTLYLFMKDDLYGSGAVSSWWAQGTPNVTTPQSMLFTYNASKSTSMADKYELTIDSANYPKLMNAVNYWNSLPDGSIIRPTFYVGFISNTALANHSPANWGDDVIGYMDIWGYKNKLQIVPLHTNCEYIVNVDQYDTINVNLEQMLMDSTNMLTRGTDYTWYLDDEFGVSPATYTVDNPNPSLNNIYQTGFKPWINTTHVDTVINYSNMEYWILGDDGVYYYTLNYYVIPTADVPANQYVNPAVFNQKACKVSVRIKPFIPRIFDTPVLLTAPIPPMISNAVTIAVQDYGSAPAGTQWNTASLPASQTNYNSAGSGLPGDGYYSIAQDIVGELNTGGGRPMDWYVPAAGSWAPAGKYDHTSGDGTGFMYIVNASASGGVFYKNTFEVCESMNLQFSMWLSNICDGTRQNTEWNKKYRIKPNVHIQIWPGNIPETTLPASGTPLLDYYTGEIPMTGIWEQYFTPVFQVPEGVDSITVFYLSVNNGGDGNDFMMDDIRIQRSNGAFDFRETDVSACFTPGSTYKLAAVWDSTVIQRLYNMIPPTHFDYIWEFYNTTKLDSVSTTTSETVPCPSGNCTAAYPDDTIALIVPGNKPGIYKLAIGAGNGAVCSAYSYYVFTPNLPPAIDKTKGDTIVTCPGEPQTISLNLTASNVDTTQVFWYWMNEGGTVPLRDSGGLHLSGKSVTVTPSRTTTYIAKIQDCADSITFRIDVPPVPRVDFGSNHKIDHYVQRVCYSASTIDIPISYLDGQGAINYKVYQEGVGNASLLGTSGTIGGNSSPTAVISFGLDKIRPSLDNFRQGMNTITCMIVLQDDSTTNNKICGSVQYFEIRFISGETVWAPGRNTTTPADNSNWNNDANWYITDRYGNRYAEAGVPMACTNVVIPGDAQNYPALKAKMAYNANDNLPTDDGFDTIPVCHNITFQFGGEVAQLQYLQYLRAYVELNLGTYSGDAAFTNTANLFSTDRKNYYPNFFSRDRYYSMTAPLKDMYAGDYAFGGKPNAFMKYADTIVINTVREDNEAQLIQKWTNSINTYKVPFPAGFGFGYEVYSGDLKESWPYAKNQKNLNAASGVVQWPYFTNSAYRDSINPRHSFTGNSVTGEGSSIFTYFTQEKPEELLPETDQVNRKSVIINNLATLGQNVEVPLANRFILENSANVIPADSVITFRDDQIDIDGVKEMLIGNPFMSHLNFQQFYLANQGAIGTYYRIWQGASSQYYSVKVDTLTGEFEASTDSIAAMAGDGLSISPMQSFFVPLLKDAVRFNIGSMSATAGIRREGTVLRSSGQETVKEILRITAANSRYSATAVIINKPGAKALSEGVPKLFSPSGNIPEIYLIQDYKKEIIEINETAQVIPVDIQTRVTGGNLRLTFSGLDNFSSTVVLKDMKAGVTKTLSASDNVYSFMNNEGDQKNRFFLIFNDYTGIEKPAPQLVSVFAANHRVQVSASSLDPVRSVTIYNIMGQIVESAGPLPVTAYESRFINEKGIYIVDIKTKNNTNITKKIIIY